MDLKSLIRNIPDFPKPGIVFRDITTLLRDREGLRFAIDAMAQTCQAWEPEFIVGMESRGFMFGVPLAYQLGVGFIPVRKPGKLPADCHSVEYELEYGSDRLDMHKDALDPGHRVVVVDDLIATGGTAKATADLLERAGAHVAGFCFAVELCELGGREKLPSNVPIVSLVQY
jgi:adenine phosphoribosyltransferase